MTRTEFAIYRAAIQHMSDDQARTAGKLARMADRGDAHAAGLLRRIALEVLTNRNEGPNAK